MLYIDIDNSCNADAPNTDQLRRWISTVLDAHAEHEDKPTDVSVVIVNEEHITALNTEFRQKAKSTNVLSFPSQLPEDIVEKLDSTPLGDIVICASVLEQEATAQNKAIEAHWAHLVVHSTLHLLGFDHINDDEAQTMEQAEIALLKQLGYNDPYLITTL